MHHKCPVALVIVLLDRGVDRRPELGTQFSEHALAVERAENELGCNKIPPFDRAGGKGVALISPLNLTSSGKER